MKKFSILISIILVLTFVLSACTPATPEPTEPPMEETEEPMEPEETEEPVEETEEPEVTEEMTEEPAAAPFEGVTVQFWHVYSGEPGEKMQALVDEFNETNEYGITVEAFDQGNYGDVEDKVNAGIQSGDLPDIVMGYTNILSDWYSVDSIVDLTPYVNDPEYGLTEAQLNDLYPFLLDAVKTPDGAWVAYPLTQSANVMVYNFTWAQELGFENPPQNTAEFEEQLCAAADENATKGADFEGTGGMVYIPNTSNFLSFLYAFGGDELNEDGTAYDFNTPEAAAVATYILDLKAKGCLYTYDGYPNPEQAQRRALVTLSSTAGLPYYTAAFEEEGNEDDWGALAFVGPDGQKAVNAFQQMLGVVPSTEDEQMASWLFVKWLTSPEIQASWIRTSKYYGTQATTEELLADLAEEDPVWASAIDLIALGPSEPQTFPAWSAVRSAVGDTAAELYNATGEDDVATILATLTAEANDLVEEIQ